VYADRGRVAPGRSRSGGHRLRFPEPHRADRAPGPGSVSLVRAARQSSFGDQAAEGEGPQALASNDT